MKWEVEGFELESESEIDACSASNDTPQAESSRIPQTKNERDEREWMEIYLVQFSIWK